MNTGKKPKWVLYDQFLVNVDVRTDMLAEDRKKLRKALNAMALRRAIEKLVLMQVPVPTTDTPQTRVKVTK